MSAPDRILSVRAQGRPARLDFPLVAVLGKRGRFLVAEPLFGPRGSRTTVSGGGGSEGDLVLVGAGKRGARVLRRLGKPWVARDVVEGLMLDRGLRRSFPRRVEDEASDRAAVEEPDEERAAARLDLRELPTFTIDPDDARDFDDAISAEGIEGGIRLWVHIADVSAYARPGGRDRGRGAAPRARASTCRARSSRCCPRRCRTAPARCVRARTSWR